MSDAKWWMDASSKWHQGLPPPGWWQAPDGRWRPPGSDDTTAEMADAPAAGGAHLPAGGPRASLMQTYRGWPPWARLAAPIAIFVLTIAVLAAAAAGGLLGADSETTATDVTTPTTTVSSAGGGAARSTATPTDAAATTASVPSTTIPDQHKPAPTTAPPPSTPATTASTSSDLHLGGRCSPEGATAVSSDGIPMTCTTQKCRGAPFLEPRWRRAAC